MLSPHVARCFSAESLGSWTFARSLALQALLLMLTFPPSMLSSVNECHPSLRTSFPSAGSGRRRMRRACAAWSGACGGERAAARR